MSDAKLTMTIGGRAVRTPRSLPVVDPSTGEVAAHAPAAEAEHVEDVMSAMAAAQPGWAAESVDARAQMMRQGADAVAASIDEIARLSTLELGAPLAFSKGLVMGVISALRYFADLKVAGEVLSDGETERVEVLRRPVGPVVAITPWNVPAYMMGLKIGPALAAGNCVVVKPSPYTPLATLRVGEILREVFPAGVLNVVSGTDELGPMLVDHPVPRKITFTGSIPTGKAIAAAAAKDLKRVTLELGGNDPAILLDDVDVEAIAPKLFWAAFTNSGQVCIAIKRIYVPAHLHDALVDALVELVPSVKLGSGLDENTNMGPLQNRAQLDFVSALVEDANTKGATVAAGGRPENRPGYFYPPTIVANAAAGMRVVDEEQFGPVLPVVPYADLGEAVTQADHGYFGLGASVWSADLDRANAVADRLEAGQVWVNTHQSTLGFSQPLTGVKHSGLGVEKGRWGLETFTEVQTRYVSRA
ncbi:aldehyde dehydrogenase family protein [Streptosporangium amethystogenes subsp. fukuiense]|uniref:Aldehyde dehydrogenase family protein n=1 Tax=Streptosporangium amethystogenes subsp. fukuiense TaxID=698418 RepID=A0ABW2TCY2_9ACTN